MRFGYWLPVFGGWLRNVDDEGMEASWEYASKLAVRSERLGYDLTLVAELSLNDVKGAEEPCLDAWSTAAGLAAVTRSLEIMVAVRPTFHPPAPFAKQAANVDRMSGGRLSLNVISSWWKEEARQYGIEFDRHDSGGCRSRTTRSRTAACAPAWSARPSRSPAGWPSSRTPASTWCCSR